MTGHVKQDFDECRVLHPRFHTSIFRCGNGTDTTVYAIIVGMRSWPNCHDQAVYMTDKYMDLFP